MKKPFESGFSDDKDKRQAVINGVNAGHARIEWVEAATAFGVRDAFDQQDFAMLILDAEMKKEGGMSVARICVRLVTASDRVPDGSPAGRISWTRGPGTLAVRGGPDRPDHPAGNGRRRAAQAK